MLKNLLFISFILSYAHASYNEDDFLCVPWINGPIRTFDNNYTLDLLIKEQYTVSFLRNFGFCEEIFEMSSDYNLIEAFSLKKNNKIMQVYLGEILLSEFEFKEGILEIEMKLLPDTLKITHGYYDKLNNRKYNSDTYEKEVEKVFCKLKKNVIEDKLNIFDIICYEYHQ